MNVEKINHVTGAAWYPGMRVFHINLEWGSVISIKGNSAEVWFDSDEVLVTTTDVTNLFYGEPVIKGPEPLLTPSRLCYTKHLGEGGEYVIPAPDHPNLYLMSTWHNTPTDRHRLKSGMCYPPSFLGECAARVHAIIMLNSKGTTDE